MEISLCMIVKDEELTIRRCLNSIKDVVDEIIIVDTGSTDNTIKYTKEYDATVYDFEWKDDFAKARNFSFSKATKDYILWLDADDILNPSDLKSFKNLKETIDTKYIDSIAMNYILSMDENGNPITSLKRNRLVKKDKNFKWIGSVHEYLEVKGNIIHTDISIIHKKEKPYTDRNLKIYEKMINNNLKLSPRDILYYANELYYNNMYIEAINFYEQFLDFEEIWFEDAKDSCLKLYKCYCLTNNTKKGLNYLFKSLYYGVPRPDICYEIGYYFLTYSRYIEAIFWFKVAIENPPNKDFMAIINHETYGYLPWIQLCVCYSNLGDYNTAYYCNETASKYKPNDLFVINNKNFLQSKLV